jgi:hypothetical protein
MRGSFGPIYIYAGFENNDDLTRHRTTLRSLSAKAADTSIQSGCGQVSYDLFSAMKR